MSRSAILQPPRFVIPWETSTYVLHNDCSSAIKFPSKEMLASALFIPFEFSSSSTKTTDEQKADTVINRHTNLDDDLFLSESDKDPYASSDNSNDSDYTPSNPNSSYKQNAVNYESSSDSDSKSKSTPPTKNTRKRQRNLSKWRRNVIKKSRNLGEKYTDWKGKVHPKRRQKNACTNCRQRCNEKFSVEERQKFFENYWKLGDVNRQRDFIAKQVEMTDKARTRVREKKKDESSGDENNTENNVAGETKERRRAFSFKYMFCNNGKKVVVCKTFFLNTLGISAQVVKTVMNKMGTTGIVAEDRRGRVCKNSKLDDSIKQSVRDHINLFETVESHYCRKNTSKRFLPPTLNISKMYGLYIEYCDQKNIKAATECIYRTIFNTEYNFSFFIPKKDICDICNRYNESTMEEKNEIEIEYQTHLRNKDIARQLKNTDKEKAKLHREFCAAVFDLEQVLPVPKSNVGLTYYKLKLSTYNFTVYNLANGDGFCYMWYESIGRRGSTEVGSCLLRFINHNIHQGVNQFSFYSDNCSGQNRNKFLFTMYSFLAQKHNIIIRHTFLEKGHTETEGDSMHSVIERASKHVPIFTPDQWYTLVRTAKKNKPYNVIEMDKEDFFDLKALTKETTFNWERDQDNEKIYLNKIRLVEANKEFPNKLLFKYDYHEEFKMIDLLQKGRKKMNIDMNKVQMRQCYKNLLPLTKKKYEHLQFLCNKKVIPVQYHIFFLNLPYSAAIKDDDEGNGSE